MRLLIRLNKKNDRAAFTFFQQRLLQCLLLLLLGTEQASANNERLCKLYSERSQSVLSHFHSIMRDFKNNKLISYSSLIEDLQEQSLYCSLKSVEQQEIDNAICKVGEYLYFSHHQEIDRQLRFFESDGKFYKVPVIVWLDDIGHSHCAYSYKTVYQVTSLINPPIKSQQHLAFKQQKVKEMTEKLESASNRLTFSAKEITHFPDIVNKAYQQLIITLKHKLPSIMDISFVKNTEKENH